ncbi:GNAT family N-acetyltransferase [Rivularia sp. PCC 7116]|uniref:GNAT family N-acetyltransferase n=1 Tax=Rivularia sp. PCC 7116 TaxID=373994 RepID=UPI001E2A0EF9|nr:GNAT family N-acetyltransferase [Rivularia sp. PCC 7116]
MFNDSSFDFMAIIYGIISIDTILRLFNNWGSFWDDKVTAKDRFILERVAVFILIPLGVFFHEVGHALATLQVGGEVREFQWRVVWGYVIAVGNFLPVESWWIAFSGNLVSIALGFIAILAVPLVKKTVLKHLFYTFSQAQLVYSLVVYPIFSFTTSRGDWLTIYDLSIKPLAQITLGIHLVIVFALWLNSKNQWLLNFLNIPSLGKAESYIDEKIITQTKRLIIREFQVLDIEALAEILAKPEVMQFSSPTGALSHKQTMVKLQSFLDSYQKYGYGKYALIHRQSGRLIGYCGIAVEKIEGKLETELGYRLDSEFWAQGLATEAAKACLKYGFDKLNLDYVLGIVEPENKASIRVLEKVGMEFVKESTWCGKLVWIYKAIPSIDK